VLRQGAAPAALGRTHPIWRTAPIPGDRGARRVSCASNLPAVAQSGGDAVDRQVNSGNDVVVGVAGPITFQELDLHVVERIEIGEAVTDRARQERIAFEQGLLAHDRQKCVDHALPFRAQPGKDAVAQLRVGDQLGIARSNRDVALCDLPAVARKKVSAAFDGGRITSDGCCWRGRSGA
jgi:hypothetical protein